MDTKTCFGRVPDQAQAGRQASATTAEPLPTPPLPEGSTGIAAKYPGDVPPRTVVSAGARKYIGPLTPLRCPPSF